MKKISATVLLTAVLLFPASTSVLADQNEALLQKQDNITISLKQSNEDNVAPVPYVESGTTMVPVRVILTELGAEVNWDSEQQMVMAVKGDTRIELKVGSRFATINGRMKSIPVAPILKDGYVMVPLRVIGESFGADVSFDEEFQEVVIKFPKTSLPENNSAEQKNNEPDELGQGGVEEGQALTYEDAVALALKHSYKLKIEQEGIQRTEAVRNRLGETFVDSRPFGWGYNESEAVARQSLLNLNQLDLGLSMAKKQIDVIEETTAFQVKTDMDNISKLNKEIIYSKEMLKHTENKQKVSRLKEANGVESEFNVTLMQKTVNEEKKKLEMLQKQMDEAYMKLNNLLGLPESERYPLSTNLVYEPVGEIDIEYHYYRVMDQDPYIWSQEKRIDQADLGLELYSFGEGQEPYAAKESDARIERNKLGQIKQNLQNSLQARYVQIQQLDKQYELLEINYEKAEEALELKRIQSDLGLAIGIEVEEAELSLKKLALEKEKIAVDYEKLKMLLYKPYLNPDYLS